MTFFPSSFAFCTKVAWMGPQQVQINCTYVGKNCFLGSAHSDLWFWHVDRGLRKISICIHSSGVCVKITLVVCTGVCPRDGVGFTQPTHYICLLLEFIQMKIQFCQICRGCVCCVCDHRPSGANNQTIWLFVISCVLCTCCLYTCMLLYNETKKAFLFGHQGSAELTSSAVVGEQGLKTNLNVN